MMYFNSCSMMSHQASAHQAEASFSCAHHAANTIALILDAALLASIFVALIGLLGILSLSLLLVLLALCLILRAAAACPKDPHPCLL